MKQIFTCLILLLSLHTYTFGQVNKDIKSEKELYLKARDSSKTLESISPIDRIINANLIKNDSLMMEAYFYKIEFLIEQADFYNKEIEVESEKFKSNIQKVLREYDSAIYNVDCIWKTNFQHNRYKFLDNLTSRYEDMLDSNIKMEYIESYYILKRKGLKSERDGVGLTLTYLNGKQNWVGIEFSIFQSIMPTYNVYYECNSGEYYLERGAGLNFGENKILQIPLGIKFLTFGYNNAVKSNQHDFSFSFLELNTPILLNPSRIGIQTRENIDKNEFYYRPSIGLGYGPVSISYSYNIPILNKSKLSEKGLLSFNISYPVTNQRNKINKNDLETYEGFLQTQKVYNQNRQEEKEIFAIVDEMPVFPGCEKKRSESKRNNCTTKELYKYLSKNTQYPAGLSEKYDGTVYVQFSIDTLGNVVDENVVKGFPGVVGYMFDREALKAVRKLPRMKPGMAKGTPQKVQYSIPIKFRDN